jgi:uncharacterized protein (TIGR01244 family)
LEFSIGRRYLAGNSFNADCRPSPGVARLPKRDREDDIMEYRQISDSYSVSGQIQPGDIAAIKDAGFKSVICNRPDDEQPGQPSSASIKGAAEAAGLGFRYIPVISGQLTMDNVEDQAQALDELEGPVFAYCRSGARSTNLYGLIQQQRG